MSPVADLTTGCHARCLVFAVVPKQKRRQTNFARKGQHPARAIAFTAHCCIFRAIEVELILDEIV